MTLCMGMAHSTPSDKPSPPPGTKIGFISRFRRKLNWLNHDHDSPSTSSKHHLRNVIPLIPRSGTVKRQRSERREHLKPHEPSPDERRAVSSVERRRSDVQTASKFSPKSSQQPIPSQSQSKSSQSLKSVNQNSGGASAVAVPPTPTTPTSAPPAAAAAAIGAGPNESEQQIVRVSEGSSSDGGDDWSSHNGERAASPESDPEFDWRWILNLSMHFRDQSDREKFFVTYAEKYNLRRRITISCDYRDAEAGTLERELSTMRYQRDKSAKIYEAIKDSLMDIQFYDTITNLKLQTSEGRLHVHVTEDLHEIIPYPPVSAIAHLRCPKYRECDLEFDSHLSGFVYKVKVHGEIFIKKEIPGPETVDEFLYEINALYALADSDNVIRFGGCIVDDKREKVKGLLISFASKGALIDILFHERGKLPWRVREKWAKQIVSGLSEIHEAGYVQGDFTLSNIVIDDEDNAKIIDINRRGCPVGWEPPEVTAMIDGLQRIGMYIGVKSDLFQLGMVLWGIAHEQDEPEINPRPLGMERAPDDVPRYFKDIVEACLCDRPQGRPSAKEIIGLFPELLGDDPQIVEVTRFDEEVQIERWGKQNGFVIGEFDGKTNVQGLIQTGNDEDKPSHDIEARSISTFTPLNHTDNLSEPSSSFQFENIRASEAAADANSPYSARADDTEHQVIEASPSEVSGDEPSPPHIVIGPLSNALLNRGAHTPEPKNMFLGSDGKDGVLTPPPSERLDQFEQCTGTDESQLPTSIPLPGSNSTELTGCSTENKEARGRNDIRHVEEDELLVDDRYQGMENVEINHPHTLKATAPPHHHHDETKDIGLEGKIEGLAPPQAAPEKEGLYACSIDASTDLENGGIELPNDLDLFPEKPGLEKFQATPK